MKLKSKRILWALCAAVIFTLPTITVISARLGKRPELIKQINPVLSRVRDVAGDRNSLRERVEGEIVAVTPHGFEPREITRPHKHFALVIENRSGLDAIDLALERENGNRVREVRIVREKKNWSAGLDLEPGRYVLLEASNPSWMCRITVTAK